MTIDLSAPPLHMLLPTFFSASTAHGAVGLCTILATCFAPLTSQSTIEQSSLALQTWFPTRTIEVMEPEWALKESTSASVCTMAWVSKQVTREQITMNTHSHTRAHAYCWIDARDT